MHCTVIDLLRVGIREVVIRAKRSEFRAVSRAIKTKVLSQVRLGGWDVELVDAVWHLYRRLLHGFLPLTDKGGFS